MEFFEYPSSVKLNNKTSDLNTLKVQHNNFNNYPLRIQEEVNLRLILKIILKEKRLIGYLKFTISYS